MFPWRGYPDVESRDRYLGGKAAELDEARRRFGAERERSGFKANAAESETICEINRVEKMIADIQAVTMEGLGIQARLLAHLWVDSTPQRLEEDLARSMGLAVERMTGELDSLAAT